MEFKKRKTANLSNVTGLLHSSIFQLHAIG